MLRFKPLKWLAFFLMIIILVPKTRGFSIKSRRNAVTNENIKFQPTPNLGTIHRNFLFFLSFFKNFMSGFFHSIQTIFELVFLCLSQSIQVFLKNVIHANREFNVYQASNVRLMFVCAPIKNHKYAIYHMVVMAFAVQLDVISPIIVRGISIN